MGVLPGAGPAGGHDEQRSKLKAETRAEKVRDELEALEDVREVEQFVDHAREMVRSVNHSTKSVARRTNAVGMATSGMYGGRLVTVTPCRQIMWTD